MSLPIGKGMPAVLEAVELPYHMRGSIGSFYVFLQDELDFQPMESPLFKRVWVTQEWVLSRRTVLFLQDAVVWACREVSEERLAIPSSSNDQQSLIGKSLMKTYTTN
jgi:hypothetical protein